MGINRSELVLGRHSAFSLTGTTLILAMGLFLGSVGAQGLGSWAMITPLPVIQSEFHGGAIGNKIYVVGGEMQRVPQNNNNASDELWIYDAGLDNWSQGPDMPGPRHHVAVTVLDDKLYVMGGFDVPCCAAYPWQAGTTSNYMFDPDSNKWFELAPIPSQFGAGMAEAYNGKIYLMGGISQGSFQARDHVFEYDPVTDNWDDTKTPMRYAREHVRGYVVDTLIYVIGGHWMNSGGQRLNQDRVEAYSPASDTWYDLGVMPNPRGGMGVGYVGGKIYVIGGEGANFSGLHAENDQYDPVTGQWDVMEPLPVGLHGQATITLNGVIHLIGGSSPQGFDPKDWHQVYTPPQVPGCTDSAANNYDRYATSDDGSCAYTGVEYRSSPFSGDVLVRGKVLHVRSVQGKTFKVDLLSLRGELLAWGSTDRGEIALPLASTQKGIAILHISVDGGTYQRKIKLF